MKIRTLAIALIYRRNYILVMEGYDSVKQDTFYRPIGGGVEFGELGEEALKREFIEEMNTKITSVQFLRVFENIFICDGIPGHEIVLLYKADLQNTEFYSQDNILCNEGGTTFLAKWIKVDDFLSHRMVLYPEGMTTYLKHNYQSRVD